MIPRTLYASIIEHSDTFLHEFQNAGAVARAFADPLTKEAMDRCADTYRKIDDLLTEMATRMDIKRAADEEIDSD